LTIKQERDDFKKKEGEKRRSGYLNYIVKYEGCKRENISYNAGL